MDYNSATQSFDASKTQLATSPNYTNNPSLTGDFTGSTLVVNPNSIIPAVVSNQTVKDKVVDMQNKVTNLSANRGMTSDGNTTKYADGTIYQDNYQEPTLPSNSSPIYGTVNGQANRIVGYNQADLKNGGQTPTYFDSNSSTPANTPEDTQILNTLDSMKASTDATTARMISSIQQKYAGLKAQQEQINKGQAAGVQNALLMGGITGQGSSSQYAPISSEGIQTAQLSYGVQKLAELDAQEQDLINQAQAAGDSKNYQLMEKQLALYEKKREEKIAQTKTLNDAIAEQTAKARETQIQASKDATIIDLYNGVTQDIGSIIKEAKKKGLTVTAKDVNDALKNSGIQDINDIANKAAQNGAPLNVVANIGKSRSVAEANALATGYLQDPLDTAYRKAQIDKIHQDIQQAGVDKMYGTDAPQLVAYAQEFASTGKIPTGIPKGSFGVIAQIAKEAPKQHGEIVSTATGVHPGQDTTYADALSNLSSVVELAKTLKEQDTSRIGGLISGSLGAITGSENQGRYLSTRSQIVDLLSRARSGAALTENEVKTYESMLPGRFSEPLGLGQNSDVKIQQFIDSITQDINQKANGKGWSVYGVSKVNLRGQDYTVGDIIKAPNGQFGRINPDGTITLVQ